MLIVDLGGGLSMFTRDQNRCEYIGLGLNAQETAIQTVPHHLYSFVSLLYHDPT